MTVDQMLYVVSRIHDWNKTPLDITTRAIKLINECEVAVEAKENIDGMRSRGLSPLEMLNEITKNIVPAIHLSEGV